METTCGSVFGTFSEGGEIVKDSLDEDYSIRIVKSGGEG